MFERFQRAIDSALKAAGKKQHSSPEKIAAAYAAMSLILAAAQGDTGAIADFDERTVLAAKHLLAQCQIDIDGMRR